MIPDPSVLDLPEMIPSLGVKEQFMFTLLLVNHIFFNQLPALHLAEAKFKET